MLTNLHVLDLPEYEKHNLGILSVCEHENSKTMRAKGMKFALDTDDIPVKKQVFELLSALCVYRPDGYLRALETLEHYKSLKKRRYRFQLVVDELKSCEVAEYTTALVAFINCLIISPASLGERVRIRNEFLGRSTLSYSVPSVSVCGRPLSGTFTAVPLHDFWNTGRQNLSSM
ncbi:Inverted formin-2 [Araneus ventricosus]|uniref:Inverted formin-2 n=1 Tax=Araneus ventricosus TaxID=182803 RepID=A0A4Y2PHQ8_ARAVE|nr:Inverted formin-2 [Araneus ventricosus]